MRRICKVETLVIFVTIVIRITHCQTTFDNRDVTADTGDGDGQKGVGASHVRLKGLCRDGWTPGSMRDVSGVDIPICLKINSREQSWEQSKSACRKDYGFLMKLDSVAKWGDDDLLSVLLEEGIKNTWTGVHTEHGRLVWDDLIPSQVKPNDLSSIRPWTWNTDTLAKRQEYCGYMNIDPEVNDRKKRSSDDDNVDNISSFDFPGEKIFRSNYRPPSMRNYPRTSAFQSKLSRTQLSDQLPDLPRTSLGLQSVLQVPGTGISGANIQGGGLSETIVPTVDSIAQSDAEDNTDRQSGAEMGDNLIKDVANPLEVVNAVKEDDVQTNYMSALERLTGHIGEMQNIQSEGKGVLEKPSISDLVGDNMENADSAVTLTTPSSLNVFPKDASDQIGDNKESIKEVQPDFKEDAMADVHGQALDVVEEILPEHFGTPDRTPTIEANDADNRITELFNNMKDMSDSQKDVNSELTDLQETDILRINTTTVQDMDSVSTHATSTAVYVPLMTLQAEGGTDNDQYPDNVLKQNVTVNVKEDTDTLLEPNVPVSVKEDDDILSKQSLTDSGFLKEDDDALSKQNVTDSVQDENDILLKQSVTVPAETTYLPTVSPSVANSIYPFDLGEYVDKNIKEKDEADGNNTTETINDGTTSQFLGTVSSTDRISTQSIKSFDDTKQLDDEDEIDIKDELVTPVSISNDYDKNDKVITTLSILEGFDRKDKVVDTTVYIPEDLDKFTATSTPANDYNDDQIDKTERVQKTTPVLHVKNMTGEEEDDDDDDDDLEHRNETMDQISKTLRNYLLQFPNASGINDTDQDDKVDNDIEQTKPPTVPGHDDDEIAENVKDYFKLFSPSENDTQDDDATEEKVNLNKSTFFEEGEEGDDLMETVRDIQDAMLGKSGEVDLNDRDTNEPFNTAESPDDVNDKAELNDIDEAKVIDKDDVLEDEKDNQDKESVQHNIGYNQSKHINEEFFEANNDDGDNIDDDVDLKEDHDNLDKDSIVERLKEYQEYIKNGLTDDGDLSDISDIDDTVHSEHSNDTIIENENDDDGDLHDNALHNISDFERPDDEDITDNTNKRQEENEQHDIGEIDNTDDKIAEKDFDEKSDYRDREISNIDDEVKHIENLEEADDDQEKLSDIDDDVKQAEHLEENDDDRKNVSDIDDDVKQAEHLEEQDDDRKNVSDIDDDVKQAEHLEEQDDDRKNVPDIDEDVKQAEHLEENDDDRKNVSDIDDDVKQVEHLEEPDDDRENPSDKNDNKRQEEHLEELDNNRENASDEDDQVKQGEHLEEPDDDRENISDIDDEVKQGENSEEPDDDRENLSSIKEEMQNIENLEELVTDEDKRISLKMPQYLSDMTLGSCETRLPSVCFSYQVEVTAKASTCDEGWYGHVLLDTCFKLLDQKMNYRNAVATCNSFGSRIVLGDSELQRRFVLIAVQTKGKFHRGEKFWRESKALESNSCSYFSERDSRVETSCNAAHRVVCIKDAKSLSVLSAQEDPMFGFKSSGEEDEIEFSTLQSESIPLLCDLTSMASEFPILWFKDGVLVKTLDKYVSEDISLHLDDSLLNVLSHVTNRNTTMPVLQGKYWCEVWDRKSLTRKRSRGYDVRFTDVISFHGSMELRGFNRKQEVLFNMVDQQFESLSRTEMDIQQVFQDVLPGLQRFSPDIVSVYTYADGVRSKPSVIEYHTYFTLNRDYTTEDEDVVYSRLKSLLRSQLGNRRYMASLDGGTPIQSFRTMSLQSTVSCPTTTLKTNKDMFGKPIPMVSFSFPKALLGDFAHSINNCSDRSRLPAATARCLGDFHTGAYWGNVAANVCTDESTIDDVNQEIWGTSPFTQQLAHMSEIPLNKKNVEEVVQDIAQIADVAIKFTPSDINKIADILDQSTQIPNLPQKVGRNVIRAVNKLMEMEEKEVHMANLETKAANRILKSVERFADNVNLEKKDNMRFVSDNVVLEIWDLKPSSRPVIGLAAETRVEANEEQPFKTEKIATVFDSSQLYDIDVDAAIELPKEVFERQEKGESIANRLTMVVYRKSNLFDAAVRRNGTSADEKNKHFQNLNSYIISASIGGKRIAGLTDKVRTIFKPLKESENSRKCVWWDFMKDDFKGGWSTQGCRYDGKMNGRDVCLCNHLTNFAVLLDFYGQDDPIAEHHELSLSIISVVGLSFSILGLSLTIISFIFFRKLRQGRAQQTLFNLSLALLFSMMVFLVGIKQTHNHYVCLVVAVMLHYFILVSFMWMLMEAILQYLTFVKILGTYITRFTLKTVLPAWGLPFIPVIAVLSIDHNLYRGGPNYCWMSLPAFYYAFAIPISLIIMVNVIIFLITVISIFSRGKGLRSNQKKQKMAMTNLQAAITSFILLGLTWIFGYLAISDARIAFQYIFTILNSLQGFFIFILFVLRKKKVRDQWYIICCRGTEKERVARSLSASNSIPSSCSSGSRSGRTKGERDRSDSTKTVQSTYSSSSNGFTNYGYETGFDSPFNRYDKRFFRNY